MIRRTIGSTLVGVMLATIIACGGAAMKTASPRMQPADASVVPGAGQDPQIAELDAKIQAALQQLGIEAPPPMATCAQPPCGGMHTLSVRPTAEPTCKPGESQTCKDTCTLADSICDSAKKICEIAGTLNNDTWANEKCGSAETSCKKAGEKCCGCA